MKNKVKKLFIGLLLLSACMRTSAQPDLAFASILSAPNTISVGQTALLTGLINNNGNIDIPAGCVLVTISVPSAICSITGLNPGSDPVWTIRSSSLPASITLWNSGGLIEAFGPDYPIILNVQGIFPGGPFTILGNAQLNPLPPPAGCVALGDLDNNNNQPTTGITVIPALSVKLSSFEGTATGCKTLLEWTSQTEENSKEYQVEVSRDGRNFGKLATIPAAGNSAVSKSYQYTDNIPSDGYNFYRLKMVDIDGKTSYSSIITIKSSCNNKIISIRPNPVAVNNILTVNLAGYSGNLKGDLVDISGKVIKTVSLKNGVNTLAIDNMAQGTYLLRVTDATYGDSKSFKIVVVK